MAPTFSRVFTPLLEALWKLVRVLLGGGRRVEDAESGNGVPVKAFSMSPRPPPNYLPSDAFISSRTRRRRKGYVHYTLYCTSLF
jgi:hypothetical protein